VKRSTGIPRSLQTKIEKSAAMALDGSTEDLKNSGVMVNADGDFVIAQPDKAAWELYQEKAKASAAAAAEAAAAEGSKELQSRGLECPIDKRMFLEPTRTPCCKRTYCNDCITNALIESDFVCPGCATEGVLLDNLSVDDQAVAKIKAYEAEKAEEKKEKEKQEQVADSFHHNEKEAECDASISPKVTSATSSPSLSNRPGSSQSKKRPAEEGPIMESFDKPNSTPMVKKQKSQDQQNHLDGSDSQAKDTPSNIPPFPFNQVPFGNLGFAQSQGTATTPFINNSFVPGGTGFMNPMMLPTGTGYSNTMANGWGQMNGIDYNFQPNTFFGDGVDGSMMSNNTYGHPNMFNGGISSSTPVNAIGQTAGFMQQQPVFQQGGGMNVFSNQQRTTFSAPLVREEDNAYFRQPVNPHRHQARQRRIRPSDYREL
jgi:protein MPE1